MAEKFSGMAIRTIDSNDDAKQIGLWGDGVAEGIYEDLKTLIDSGATVHGLKVIGRIDRYYDDSVDNSTLDVPTGVKAIKGSLIISRDGAGPKYIKGKFPNTTEYLDVICQALITGTLTIGAKTITSVTPKVSTGSKFIK